MAKAAQGLLFSSKPLPDGFVYQPELISADQERELIANIVALPLMEFEFHGFTGKRRVVSFGWSYDFSAGGVRQAGEIPDFLLPLREAAGRFAGLDPARLAHALVTEYSPGAAIGWHKDKREFGEVIGISLASNCRLRFRRRTGDGWERAEVLAEARSAYLLSGPARAIWEHSIPPVEQLRYSITFRQLNHGPAFETAADRADEIRNRTDPSKE